ncbi:MAG: amino acid permease, partial [Loigolactobacillus coryniformis]|nr:amino acid permease [Loigolactobacillus coryniformis]
TSRPFVQVFSSIGVVGAAGILNFVVLPAAMSATNSAIFSTSRTLHALARSGNAPKRFTKLGRNNVPNLALRFSSAILFVIVILNYLMPASIFNLISGVSTINFVFVWLILLWCHIKYRQKYPQGYTKFSMPGYPITDYLSIFFFAAVLVFLLFDPSTRVSVIIALVWFVLMFVAYQLMQKTSRKA